MSIAVHEDYRRTAYSAWLDKLGEKGVRRTLIAACGCALMAISGIGLGMYLDTSTAVAAVSSPIDAPSN